MARVDLRRGQGVWGTEGLSCLRFYLEAALQPTAGVIAFYIHAIALRRWKALT